MELYLNVPARRFRVAPNAFPLVQVGPGLIKLNTVDSEYDCESFEERAINVTQNFLEVYHFKDEQQNYANATIS